MESRSCWCVHAWGRRQGKAVHVHAIKAYEGVEVQIQSFLISAASRPNRFTPGESPPPQYPLNRRSGGPQSRPERLGRRYTSLTPAGYQTTFLRCPALNLLTIEIKLSQLLCVSFYTGLYERKESTHGKKWDQEDGESEKKLCRERYRIILQYQTIYTVNIVGKVTAKAVIRTR